MEPVHNKPTVEKCQKLYGSQPISCPWSSIQPYPNATVKNDLDPSTSSQNRNKSSPSIQQSSSHFFYFLRLMQLFPEVHPASIHTVLCLCKNNFFYAVDKLLYARKCKTLYYQKHTNYRRRPYDRNQTFGGYNENNSNIRNEEVLDLKIPSTSIGGTSRTCASTPKMTKDIVRLKDSYPKSSESSASTTKVEPKCTCRFTDGFSNQAEVSKTATLNSYELPKPPEICSKENINPKIEKIENSNASDDQCLVAKVVNSPSDSVKNVDDHSESGKLKPTNHIQDNIQLSLHRESILQSDIIIL